MAGQGQIVVLVYPVKDAVSVAAQFGIYYYGSHVIIYYYILEETIHT